MKILVINGPNLNLLGKREPNNYGNKTLEDINISLKKQALKLGIEVEIFQSNHEGDIVEKIHNAVDNFDGILINPAAFTHTSIAIRDALLAVNLPSVEVHLSNLYSREEFRHHSYIAPACIGQISGFKENSYFLGLSALISFLK